ncbi:MAG: NAD(P)-dependent oxidoreductase [Cytophagales bacterium]|nr:NAD(P)-dependent oxidoreductase [Cytophagales bacterium]
MKILVTGAFGFIGSHVIHFLARTFPSHIIHATYRDSFDHRFDEYKSVFNKKLDLDKPGFGTLDSYYDIIIHLAWDKVHHYDDPGHLGAILQSQKRFIDWALGSATHLAVAGTCFEYGLQEGELFENFTTAPVTNYGRAKDQLRAYLFSQASTADTQHVKWLRVFYTYGKGQYPNSLIPQLESALDNNLEVFNMSAGQQLRDYLEVRTLAKYIGLAALDHQETGIFNCCSGKPIKLVDFVKEYLKSKFPTKSIKLNLGYYKYSPVEPMAFWGNNERIMRIVKSDGDA